MSKPYGYAGLYQDTVYALGRSEAGMERDRKNTEGQIGETIELDSSVPCTRRAFDAVRSGEVRVGVGSLRMIDGVLDVLRGPGRPARAPGRARTRTYGVSVSVDVHEALMALPDAHRAALAIELLEAIERALR